MFKLKSRTEKTGLETAIDSVLTDMNGFTSDAPEYATMAKHLTKLYKLKEIDKPEHVSYDALASIVGSLLGIVMIISYERTNIFASKAVSFLPKLR